MSRMEPEDIRDIYLMLLIALVMGVIGGSIGGAIALLLGF